MKQIVRCALAGFLILAACSTQKTTDERQTAPATTDSPSPQLTFAGEKRLANMRQLTFGGENAEAHWNGDGTEIIFQSTRGAFECDQIFRMDADGKNIRLVSTGVGRTTCGFIFPNQPKILYSSSHATFETCPPKPDDSRGYVWPLLPDFDIYVAGPNGENPTPLAPHDGYDAEGVVSPQGDGIVFTSTRSGDVDIWFMKPDGTGLAQLTDEIGYDGGAFFSRDGQRIVYRAYHPQNEVEMKDYQELLAEDLVRPGKMDLYVMNRDGSNKRKILANDAANFAPYWHPDGERLIFASNIDSEGGRNVDLYLVGADGTGLERVTFNPTFDAFPMFSYDGTRIVFTSNRHGDAEGDTNIFVADWIEEVAPGVEAKLEGDAKIAEASWTQRATKLSAEEMDGRGLGSEGLEKAAEYLVAQFEAIGLEPAGNNGSYLQTFPATTDNSALEVEGTEDVANVVGRTGPKEARAIIIGAHYDHLGHGGEKSLAGDSNTVHYGADDNASGVATLLELAEALIVLEPKRQIFFVAFTGEEAGLLGSHHFVQHPPVSMAHVDAMLNFDMVGRLRDGHLTVLGSSTAKSFVDVLRRAQIGLPLDLNFSPDGYGPSDHMAFSTKEVPVLHFFTGAHEDYHTPGDTADKLNAEGAVTVTEFALRIAHELATTEIEPGSAPWRAADRSASE